jgi:hypothetical protein
VLDKIAYLLDQIPGNITISGNTDDKPIATKRFHSNWELSAARAISVAHHLYERGVDKDRMIVTGNADTQPIFANDTEAHRSRNRRVEIVLTQQDNPRVEDAPDAASPNLNQSAEPLREIIVNQPPGLKGKPVIKNNAPIPLKVPAQDEKTKIIEPQPAK